MIDIIFVLGFYISVLFIKKLNKKGYFWDNANAILLKGTEPYIQILEKYRQ